MNEYALNAPIGDSHMLRLREMTEPQLRTTMSAAGRAAGWELPRGTLFVVLAFDDPGVAQYISNARRVDVVRALREAADRLEARQEIPR